MTGPWLIEWEDISDISEWQEDAELDAQLATPAVCRNVGWIVREDDRAILLCSSLGDDLDPKERTYGLCQRIPKGVILKMVQLDLST